MLCTPRATCPLPGVGVGLLVTRRLVSKSPKGSSGVDLLHALPEHGRHHRLGARMQVFDSRAFALGGAHSSRFIPAAAANAGVRPPLPRAPGGRPVAPNVGVPLPPELAAPAQAPATQANGFATQARPQHVTGMPRCSTEGCRSCACPERSVPPGLL